MSEHCTCEYPIDFEDGTEPQHRPGCPAGVVTTDEQLRRELLVGGTNPELAEEALEQAIEVMDDLGCS